MELCSVGAGGAEGPVELGGRGASEDVEAPVTITVSVFGSVTEASRGPSSPQANGNAGFNVAKLHAEPDDDAELVGLGFVEPLSVLEEVGAAELVALALVVSVPVLEDAV